MKLDTSEFPIQVLNVIKLKISEEKDAKNETTISQSYVDDYHIVPKDISTRYEFSNYFSSIQIVSGLGQ